MAFVSQATKSKIAAGLKAAKLPKTLKYTLGVRHHSTLVVTLRQVPAVALDDYIADKDGSVMDADNARAIRKNFEAGSGKVNEYHMERQFEGATLKMLQTIITTIKTAGDWFDKSDSMTDYFHTAFYIDIQFGGNTPCEFVGKRRTKKVDSAAPSPLAKALETIMAPGFGETAPAPETNVVAFPEKPQRTDAELVEFARAEMVQRFIAAMRKTVVGGAFSDAALDTLATAAVGVVIEEAK